MNKVDIDLNEILNGGARKTTNKKLKSKTKSKTKTKSITKSKNKPIKSTKQKKTTTKISKTLSRESNDVFSPRKIKEVKYDSQPKKIILNKEYISEKEDKLRNKPYAEYDLMALRKLEKSKIDIVVENTEREEQQ